MDWNSYDFTRDNVYTTLKEKGYTHLSYSQISTYNSCQHKWKKVYGEKMKDVAVSIDLLFGTAMHFVLQEWITCLYNESVKKANEMDLDGLLKKTMMEEYEKGLLVGKGHFSTPLQLREYFYHGQEIIKEITKRRLEFFPTKDHKLLGIELPLVVDLDEKKKIVFTAFLDIAIKNTKTDEVLIIDLKTSRQGWNAKKKADPKSMSQLLMYKKYFSEQYNVPLEKISILYLILKRVLYERAEFPQKRLQKFIPASGKPSINKVIANVEQLVNHGFKDDGSYNLDASYPKIKDKTICQYCFLHKTEHCNWKDDD